MIFLTTLQMQKLRALAKFKGPNPGEGESVKLAKGIYLHKVKGASLLPAEQRYFVDLQGFAKNWNAWSDALFCEPVQAPTPEVHVSEEARKGFTSYFEQLEALRKEREAK